jgi:hypothetical protein
MMAASQPAVATASRQVSVGNGRTGLTILTSVSAGRPAALGRVPRSTGGFTVTDIRFVDNSFSTLAAGCVGQFGVWFVRPWPPYDGGPTDGWRRRGNRVLETGQNVDSGNPSGPGLNCG